MRLIEYTPDRFEALCKAAEKIQGNYSLRHRSFVDHYYAGREASKLYLFLSPLEDVLGLVGVERMPFEYDSRGLTLGIGTNFHALQRGVGGLLFMQWVKSCSLALEYGGTEDAHVIIRKQNWTYFPGIRIYTLNHDYPVYPSDPAYRRVAKWMVRRAARKKISAFNSRFPGVARGRVSVHEEFVFTEDLLPSRSPFRFRLAPTVEYLSWRYNLELPFVTYRLFRILVQGRNAGYVILNESDQRLLIAQCDADDAATLAYGVILSILETGRRDSFPRSVLLTCSHPDMAEIYMKFGFRRGKRDYPMAMGGLHKKNADISTDTTGWLVNFDWGDNGLLGPFVKGVKQGREQNSWA